MEQVLLRCLRWQTQVQHTGVGQMWFTSVCHVYVDVADDGP